jgi:hypothetical protein
MLDIWQYAFSCCFYIHCFGVIKDASCVERVEENKNAHKSLELKSQNMTSASRRG